MSSYVEGRLNGWKGWQVSYPEDMMEALLLGKLIDAFWLGDRDIWEELNPLDFKILMIKYSEINVIYLDSNLPFKNSLGLKLQEEKLNTSQVLHPWDLNHNPKLFKMSLFHEQRQKNIISVTAVSLYQKERKLDNCESTYIHDNNLNCNWL